MKDCKEVRVFMGHVQAMAVGVKPSAIKTMAKQARRLADRARARQDWDRGKRWDKASALFRVMLAKTPGEAIKAMQTIRPTPAEESRDAREFIAYSEGLG